MRFIKTDFSIEPSAYIADWRKFMFTGISIALAGLISGSVLAAFPVSINLSSLDGNNGSRANGIASGDFLGYSISKIGDFNADGRDDFIIGAPNSSTAAGAAYVLYGAANGLAYPINLANLALNNEGFRIDGAVINSQLGSSVASAGDINGDGLTDLIVGAPGESAAYVVFGRANGYPNGLAVSSLDGVNGFRISGLANAQLGYSVNSAGDVNGDGFNDVIVSNGSANLGVGYVILGRNTGFQANLDVTALNGGNGFSITGATTNQSNFVVSSAGDFNADGVSDMIIGSWNASVAYLVFGHTAIFPAAIDLSLLNGGNGFVLNDNTSSSQFGGAVAGAGDINGDNIADIVIGAPMASTDSTNNQAGKSYVVFGSTAPFSSSFNVSTLNGGNGGFQIYGAATRDRSGWAVSGAGDINGDSIDDLAIGAPYSSYNGSASGTSYVLFGNAGGFSSPLNLSGNPVMPNHLDGANGFQLPGVSTGELSGWAISGGGDLNGDGADDLLIGARLATVFNGAGNLTNAGVSYVFYGQIGDTTAPVSTITNSPSANAFGWNNSPVSLSVTAQDEAAGSGLNETRCALDPVSIPADFNALSTAACNSAFINTEGAHVFYAASSDKAGNQETPINRAINIDLSAPVVNVTGVKANAVYRRGKAPKTGCLTSDAVSGVVSKAVLTISGGNSNGVGVFTATCSGALDKAGNTGSKSVSYTVK
ncbi:MAG: beta strand repeat-containing protein [Methylococcaceae bacterium]